MRRLAVAKRVKSLTCVPYWLPTSGRPGKPSQLCILHFVILYISKLYFDTVLPCYHMPAVFCLPILWISFKYDLC